jgi:hypothetical protein
MLQRPVVSYANGREIVITFGQEEAPALAFTSARLGLSRRVLIAGTGPLTDRLRVSEPSRSLRSRR